MAMVINTNISSLNAQRQLAGSASKLATSMERLSSGLRINSAKDDAAGLAISNRMTTQITGLNVAQRNANDGISLAQTAEGALSTIGNNLQRIRELAVQSRNATNSTEDREALQKEVAQLKEEIDRVAKNTKFNGTNLLDGSFTDQEFQVGADQGQVIKVSSIVNASIDSLGTWDSIAQPSTSKAISMEGDVTVPKNDATDDGAAKIELKIGSTTIATVSYTNTDTANDVTKTAAQIAADLDTQLATATLPTGVTITGKLADGTLKISNANGTADTFSIAAVNGNGTPANDVTAVKLKEEGGTAAASVAVAAGQAAETGKKGFAQLDISSVAGADNAIKAMDGALKAVNSARADLGAIQNRFESVVSNLATTSENLTASRSRILDTDFAQETANLSSAQVLQQAGTAMVAQANQLPQNVLSLLR